MLIVNQIIDLKKEVSITPKEATLGPGESFRFDASIYNTFNRHVSWSVTAGSGTVTGGLYEAPLYYTGSNSIETVRATLLEDPTVYDTALIRLTERRRLDVVCNEYTTYAQVRGSITNYEQDVLTHQNMDTTQTLVCQVAPNTVTGDNVGHYNNMPVYHWYEFVLTAYDEKGSPYVPEVTGSFVSQGNSTLPTYLTQTASNKFRYCAVVSDNVDEDTVSDGWPAGYSAGVDTIKFETTFNGGIILSKTVEATWTNNSITYYTEVPLVNYEYFLMPVSGQTVRFRISTRDTVPISLTTPTVIGEGTYDDVNGTFTSPDYTPTGGIAYVEITKEGGYTERIPIVYDLRIDGVTATASDTDDIVITGGLFHAGMTVYIGGTKVPNFTVSVDNKTLTIPSGVRLNMGSTARSVALKPSTYDIDIAYGSINGRTITKKIPTAVILTGSMTY